MAEKDSFDYVQYWDLKQSQSLGLTEGIEADLLLFDQFSLCFKTF